MFSKFQKSTEKLYLSKSILTKIVKFTLEFPKVSTKIFGKALSVVALHKK